MGAGAAQLREVSIQPEAVAVTAVVIQATGTVDVFSRADAVFCKRLECCPCLGPLQPAAAVALQAYSCKLTAASIQQQPTCRDVLLLLRR